MRFDNIKLKKFISTLVMISLVLSISNIQVLLAGQFTNYKDHIYYIDDDGQPIKGQWRWLDTDGDTIAECYRFDDEGKLVSSKSMPDGKFVNKDGQWEVDGIVQKVYFTSMRPLKENTYQMHLKQEKTATASRINASGKDLEKLAAEKAKKKRKVYQAPDIKETTTSDDGYYYAKKIKRPDAERIDGQTIVAKEEDTITYSDGTTNFLPGVDASKFVSASKNFTREVETAKIYGGQVWEKCMCLSGHESYAKFVLSGNNYFRIEVAHQAHGTSTAETKCYLEYYIDDEFIDSYDQFVDSNPIIIEDWFDEGEKTIKLVWIVNKGSKGRKLYLRDARFRKIIYDDDD